MASCAEGSAHHPFNHVGVPTLSMESVVLEESSRKQNKYQVTFWHGGVKKTIHFGKRNSRQYKDTTGLGIFSHLDHGDEVIRQRYLSRYDTKKNNPLNPAYWSLRYLFSG